MSAPIGSLVHVVDLTRLGLGRLRSVDNLGRAAIQFSGEGVKVLAPGVPLRRARLSTETRVRFRSATGEVLHGAIIEDPRERNDGGFVYRVLAEDGAHDVWEGHLVPADDTADPLQMLRSYRWDTPRHYQARWAMLDIHARWRAASGGMPAILGARVLPLGHQIYAARRVLFDRTPRFILADEVGLGKTVEAGMIIQALQAEAEAFSTVVIAPGSMSRQWLTETYLRFGARPFHHIDRARIARESRAALGRLVAERRLIVSTTALEADEELAAMVASRSWDMVVVDEAHQIPPGHALHPMLERLARASAGLLLLSATPSKRDMVGLMGLLALVAPNSYATGTEADLQAKYDRRREIWDRLNFTRKMIDGAAAEGRDLDPEEVEFVAGEWDDLITGDAIVDALLTRMRAGDASAALELVAYVQEFHRLDHRIIRTRRSSLADGALDWSRRALLELTWLPSNEEAIFLNHFGEIPADCAPHANAVRALYRRACTTSPHAALRFLTRRRQALDDGPAGGVEDAIRRLAIDAGPNDEPLVLNDLVSRLPALEGEADWLRAALALAQAWRDEGGFSRADRLAKWLAEHLADPTNQVLVFVQDAAAADDLADHLAFRLAATFGSEAVARFHRDMDESDLAQTALRFQHDRGCRVLVSDELGGEGRNFQNASAVVHFDVPVACARLEQRIGRLDRVGRDPAREVLSVTLDPGAASEQALLVIHRDVFRVFDRSIGGLEFVLPALQTRVLDAYGDDPAALRALAPHLRDEIDAVLAATDEAFDLSLDATRPQLDRAAALAAALGDETESEDAAATLRRWASRLGVQSQHHDNGEMEFRWTNGSLDIRGDRLRIGTGADEERRLVRGTLSRATALAREDLQFFAPGHDLVDGMLAEAEQGSHSRATAFILKGFPKFQGVFLLQVLARAALDDRLLDGHDVGPGLRARARAEFGTEIIAEVMMLRDRNGAKEGIIRHPELRSLLDHPRHDLALAPIDPAAIADLPFLPELWRSIDVAVPAALASIADRVAPLAAARADALAAGLRAEIGFLRWQAGVAADRAAVENFQAAVAAREALVDSVRTPRTDLFGLALIALG